MASEKTSRRIGFVALFLGLSLGLMLFFEIKDGALFGSNSNGMTLSSNPVTFYVSTILQGLVVILLGGSGVSLIRNKK